MSLNRRQVLLGGLGMGAAAGLSGCAGLTGKKGTNSGDSTPAPGEKVTLTFVNWSGDDEKKAFDAVIAAFQQENPDITVKTDTVPYQNVQTNLDSRFQAGNPPDLFRVSYIDIGQYTSEGVLLDVSGTFDQPKVDAFEPGLWEGVVFDGKPYGVPHQIDTTAILYRLDAFEAAGITNIPTSLEDAWSWDEFADASRKLAGIVKNKQSPFVYDWQSAGAYRWLTWLFEAGGTLLGPDLKSPAIDTPEGRKAVEFTASFFTNKWVARNTSVKSQTYPDTEFIAGSAAMVFAGDFLVPGINTGVGKKFEYGSMVQPRDVAAATDLGGNAIVVTEQSKNPEVAAEFAKFLATKENMQLFCEQTGVLPVRNDLVDAKLNFTTRNDLMPVFQKQATTLPEKLVKTSTLPAFPGINQALVDSMDQYLSDPSSSVDTVIAALTKGIEKALQV